MSNKLSGPHFCVGTGQIIASQIFSDLLARAEQNGGHLSAMELRQATARFMAKIPDNFDLYESVYASCMATLNGSTSRIFDRKSLPRFVFFAYLIDIIKPVFRNQIDRFGKEWALWLAEAMANNLANKLEIDPFKILHDAYERLAVKHGHDVNNEHVLRCRETTVMMRGFLQRLNAATKNGSEVEHMSNWLNEGLRAHYKVVGANPLLVVNTQCRDFVRRIEDEKLSNPYRRHVFLDQDEDAAQSA